MLIHVSCLQDKEPLGIIPLENLSVQKVDDPKKPVSLHCLVLCQRRLSGSQREERVRTPYSYHASQREGATPNCLVPPSKYDGI